MRKVAAFAVATVLAISCSTSRGPEGVAGLRAQGPSLACGDLIPQSKGLREFVAVNPGVAALPLSERIVAYRTHGAALWDHTWERSLNNLVEARVFGDELTDQMLDLGDDYLPDAEGRRSPGATLPSGSRQQGAVVVAQGGIRSPYQTPRGHLALVVPDILAAVGSSIGRRPGEAHRHAGRILASAAEDAGGYDGSAAAHYVSMLVHRSLGEWEQALREAEATTAAVKRRGPTSRIGLRSELSAIETQVDVRRALESDPDKIAGLDQTRAALARRISGDPLATFAIGTYMIPGYSMAAIAESERGIASVRYGSQLGLDPRSFLDLAALALPRMESVPAGKVKRDGPVLERLGSAMTCLTASLEATEAMDPATGAAALQAALEHLDRRFWADLLSGLSGDLKAQLADPNKEPVFLQQLNDMTDGVVLYDGGRAELMLAAAGLTLAANDRLGVVDDVLVSAFSDDARRIIKSVLQDPRLDEYRFDPDLKEQILRHLDFAFDGIQMTSRALSVVTEGPSRSSVGAVKDLVGWAAANKSRLIDVAFEMTDMYEDDRDDWRPVADAVMTFALIAGEGAIHYQYYALGDERGEADAARRIADLMDGFVRTNAPRSRTGSYQNALRTFASSSKTYDERSRAMMEIIPAVLDGGFGVARSFEAVAVPERERVIGPFLEANGEMVKRAAAVMMYGGGFQRLAEEQNWAEIIRLLAPVHDALLASGDDSIARDEARDIASSLLAQAFVGIEGGVVSQYGAMATEILGPYMLALSKTGDARRLAQIEELIDGMLDGVEEVLESDYRGGVELLPDSFMQMLARFYSETSNAGMLDRVTSTWSRMLGDRPLLVTQSLDRAQASRVWRNSAGKWHWRAYSIVDAAAKNSIRITPDRSIELMRSLDRMRPSSLSDDIKEAALFKRANNQDLADAYEEWREASLRLERAQQLDRQVAVDAVRSIAAAPETAAQKLYAMIEVEAQTKRRLQQEIRDANLNLSLDPISLSSLQASLRVGETLVGSSIVGDYIATVALEKTGSPAVIWTKYNADNFNGMVSSFSNSLKTSSAGFDTKNAHALYLAIFGADQQNPVRRLVEQSARIVWTPGVGLDDFPIAALITSQPTTTDLARARWFGASHELMTAPSFEAFQVLRQTDSRFPSRSVLVVGDIPFTGGSQSSQGRSNTLSGSAPAVSAAALPASLLSLYPPTMYGGSLFDPLVSQGAQALRGSAATEAAIQEAADERSYESVVFYTHAADLQNSAWVRVAGTRALVVYPQDPRDLAGDGLLEIDEIANAGLRARLIVLAACATGAAGAADAEPLSGIARAFLIGGAGAVLASHNKVDDRSAALLALYVTEDVRGGRSPSAALLAAQTRLKADPRYAHPYYWAQYEVIGEGAR